MADTPICDMSVPELKNLILLKDKEYWAAIKSKKVFWEVKEIYLQRKYLEWQLVRKDRKYSDQKF